MGARRASADLVFECLSESAGVYDRTIKADTYPAFVVRELWLIDSDDETIETRNADFKENVPVWQR